MLLIYLPPKISLKVRERHKFHLCHAYRESKCGLKTNATMLLKSLSPCIFALALLPIASAEDTVSSGNYSIHLCNSGQLDSEASKLQKLLPQVYNGLQKVVADLQLGTGSLHGYSTFFKNDSSKAEVQRVYEKIAAGASVVVGRYRSNIRYPTFICANNIPETDLLYQYCMRNPNTALMTRKNTELIYLCPLFWTIKRQAILPDCPLVVANTLTPNDAQLLENQEALLIGALVHFYHDVHEDLILTITDASELDASESLLNPPNYALYYAGEYLLSLPLGSINLANHFKIWQPCRLVASVSQTCENHMTNSAAY